MGNTAAHKHAIKKQKEMYEDHDKPIRFTKRGALAKVFQQAVPEAVLYTALEVQSHEEHIPVKPLTPQSLSMDVMARPYTYDTRTQFINSLIISKDDVAMLEKATRAQCNSPIWSMARRGRFTASNFYSVYTKVQTIKKNPDTETDSLLARIMGYERVKASLKALKNGKEMEGKARKSLFEQFKSEQEDAQCHQLGLFLLEHKAYLGASTDAMFTCKCHGSQVVEIKCPESCKDTVPSPDLCKYLKYENDTLDFFFEEYVAPELFTNRKVWKALQVLPAVVKDSAAPECWLCCFRRQRQPSDTGPQRTRTDPCSTTGPPSAPVAIVQPRWPTVTMAPDGDRQTEASTSAASDFPPVSPRPSEDSNEGSGPEADLETAMDLSVARVNGALATYMETGGLGDLEDIAIDLEDIVINTPLVSMTRTNSPGVTPYHQPIPPETLAAYMDSATWPPPSHQTEDDAGSIISIHASSSESEAEEVGMSLARTTSEDSGYDTEDWENDDVAQAQRDDIIEDTIERHKKRTTSTAEYKTEEEKEVYVIAQPQSWLLDRPADLSRHGPGRPSALQPLDVGVNKALKDRMKRKLNAWMVDRPHEYTKMGNRRLPSKNQILSWLAEAWGDIPEEIVKRSFRKAGISLSMDGTEDDAIYQSDNDL
ncbi:POGK [Branchiostoma lanceolatum]|uniref:POGK protein n=1 Tax=Branchiostoma lanceolatum TaxID=7740 RepID=A0A8J9YV25_BRALA|nr:POGK [Branchiostoma lanceolatum]